jgi:hypothetical protein
MHLIALSQMLIPNQLGQNSGTKHSTMGLKYSLVEAVDTTPLWFKEGSS